MALLDLEAEYAKAASLMAEGGGGGGGGGDESSKGVPVSSRRQKKEKKEKGVEKVDVAVEAADSTTSAEEAAVALKKEMESAREAASMALVAAAAALAEKEVLVSASGKKGTTKVRKIDRRRREWRALRNVQSVDGVVGAKTMMGVAAAVSTDEESLLLVGSGEGVLDDVVDLRIGGQTLAKLDLSYNHRIFEDNLGDDDLEYSGGSIVVENEETPAPSPHGSSDDSMNNNNSSAFQLLAALEKEPQFLLMLPSHTTAESQLQQQQQQQLQQQLLHQQLHQQQYQQYQQYQPMHIVDSSSTSRSFHNQGISRVISNQSEDFLMKLDEANADELESDDSSLDELCSTFLA